jgi:hypothetical protein
VPEHEELDVLGGGRAARQQDQPEYLPKHQVQQPQRHARIMPNQQSPLVKGPGTTSGTPQDFWHPARLRTRSPPRLGRCRTVRPLLASTGLVPASAANAASSRHRSG